MKKRGPKPQPDKARSTRIPVLVTPRERAIITGNAERSGMKVSTFLRVRGLEA